MGVPIQKKIVRLSVIVIFIMGANLFGNPPTFGLDPKDVDIINSRHPKFKVPFGGIPVESPANGGVENDQSKSKDYCNIDTLNNFQTAVTFYGDSRLDWIDLPYYGYANLDAYLRASREEGWNVQNLGNAVTTSEDLLKHISLCYRAQFPYSQLSPLKEDLDPNLTAEQREIRQRTNFHSVNQYDFQKMQFPKYVTAKNIVFETGGNDFMFKLLEFIYLPWMMPRRVENVRLNIRNIVAFFRRRDRNVLLVGNYPAVSSSLILGSAQKQTDRLSSFRSIFSELSNFYLNGSKAFSLVEIAELHDAIIASFVNAFTKGKTSDPLISISDDEKSKLLQSSCLLPQLISICVVNEIFSPATRIFTPKTAPPNIFTYKGWILFNSTEQGTFTSPSIAMLMLEGMLPATVEETNGMPFVTDSISSASYHPVWGIFAYPFAEPWVANPLLMAKGDAIHPNAMGFKLWSDSVSEKIRSLGWHNNPRQFRNGDLRDYDAMNTPALSQLQTYRNRLGSALEKIKTDYLGALHENAKLQLDIRRAVLIGRISGTDESIVRELARLQRERERLLAEAEAARLAAIRQAEADRLAQEAAIAAAAVAEAGRQQQLQEQLAREERDRQNRYAAAAAQANNYALAVAACFFFGVCHF